MPLATDMMEDGDSESNCVALSAETGAVGGVFIN